MFQSTEKQMQLVGVTNLWAKGSHQVFNFNEILMNTGPNLLNASLRLEFVLCFFSKDFYVRITMDFDITLSVITKCVG